MATLKGQNFRIYSGDSVIGMATNCTVTLTNNTADASTKDDVGGAQKPEVTSKAWSVQVESLSVADTAALLTAIKQMKPFTLRWDETATSNNQTGQKATYARTGQAYLNDVTFQFNDRENSSKSLQFTGTGALAKVASDASTTTIGAGSYTKGQFVRLFLSSDNSAAPSRVIAAARTLSLHVSLSLETATTKDTTGDWEIQEPTGLSYDISTGALVNSGETITSDVGAQGLSELETIYEAGTPVKWLIANANGANQRTMGTKIASGSCIVSSLTINAANRQNATYDAQLTGYGEYTVAA